MAWTQGNAEQTSGNAWQVYDGGAFWHDTAQTTDEGAAVSYAAFSPDKSNRNASFARYLNGSSVGDPVILVLPDGVLVRNEG